MKRVWAIIITAGLMFLSACTPPETYDGAALEAGKKAKDKLENAMESATENQNALDEMADEILD